MTEKKKFRFAGDTSLGRIEGDLCLEIDGNNIEGTFNAFGVDIHLLDGHYENGHFKGGFKETVMFIPLEGTIEGQIEGDDCTVTLTTESGSRTLHSM